MTSLRSIAERIARGAGDDASVCIEVEVVGPCLSVLRVVHISPVRFTRSAPHLSASSSALLRIAREGGIRP